MPKQLARRLQSRPTLLLDPDDLTQAIEAELAALAEIDADYAEELHLLGLWCTDRLGGWC